MKGKIKVLIVDDSAVFRQTLTKILSEDPLIEVIGTASDPFIAAAKMTKVVPDVITLDIEMPRMDGLTFLRKIMSQHPIPVVMISNLTGENLESTFKAFEYGAVEVMSKEMFLNLESDEDVRIRICEIIKSASEATLKRKTITENVHRPKLSADAVISQVRPRNIIQTSDKVILVGASTGGTEAIKIFLEALPVDIPGIVIVQHMPEHYTKSFADRLNGICKIEVKEAEDGDRVMPGRALIAHGNYHILLKKIGKDYYVQVKEGPLVNRHRPSVDVLFRSAALYAGNNGIGILLTGMGDDGARGLLEMKEAGAYTIAQDEKSCVVFGMPKEAIKLNAAKKILCLEDISNHLLSIC